MTERKVAKPPVVEAPLVSSIDDLKAQTPEPEKPKKKGPNA